MSVVESWYPPRGFRFSACASGIKKSGKPDLGLIIADRPAVCAGVFTRNRVVAAPVRLSRQTVAGGRCQAILVNSGNANACTGQAGMTVAKQTVDLIAEQLDLDPKLVAVASTGVIGQELPLAPFETAFPRLVEQLTATGAGDVAEAMMTTDAFPKIAAAEEPGAAAPYRILGLAKGAGMIHPDMATMLAFVLTDADLDRDLLDRALRQAVARSFNAITVDGDTSTNDTVLLLANGAAEGARIEAGSSAAETFCRNLERVMLALAKMIVRDGEGATKLAQIRVTGAEDVAGARRVARSVATSLLAKTAFFGEDANWGRIIAAVGYAGVELDPERIDIYFDQVQVAHQGMAVGPQMEEAATAVLRQAEFVVRIELNQGDAEASYYSSDIGHEYIRINAEYRT